MYNSRVRGFSMTSSELVCIPRTGAYGGKFTIVPTYCIENKDEILRLCRIRERQFECLSKSKFVDIRSCAFGGIDLEITHDGGLIVIERSDALTFLNLIGVSVPFDKVFVTKGHVFVMQMCTKKNPLPTELAEMISTF